MNKGRKDRQVNEPCQRNLSTLCWKTRELAFADRVLRTGFAVNGDATAVEAFLGDDRPAMIALGSVARPDPGFVLVMEAISPVLVLSGSSASPIRNVYGTPLTLGADRLANVVGAMQRFPGRAILAIDLGTCITYDVCEADGTYAGGAISPGLRMRATAMNAYSARLPWVDRTALTC